MPALTYEQDSETDMNEGSFDETPATPVAGREPKSCYNDLGVTVAETVTVSTLSNSSSEFKPVNVRNNMPAITIRNSEIDVNKGSSDSDIDETPAKPAAKECSENHNNKQMNEVSQQKPEARPK